MARGKISKIFLYICVRMNEKLSSNQIKLIHSLAKSKGRRDTGLFIVEGEKCCAELLESDYEVVATYRRDEIGEQTMSRISALDSPSPILCVAKIPEKEAVSVSSGLCLALDGVRDPGNLGTIIRIADWFGISRIYASEDTVDQYNPKVVQSTMGAVFRNKVYYCNISELCREFRAAGKMVAGTFMNGDNIYQAQLPAEGLLVMGSESFGVSDAVAALVDRRLHIPSYSIGKGSESLNVAIATAICVSEFKRR